MISTFNTTDPARTFFTADLHLGHQNIIKYARRPWTRTVDMDNALIRNINARVQSDSDILVVVGDLTMESKEGFRKVRNWVNQMNGTKILVLGNHDRFKPQTYIKMGFSVVATSLVLSDGTLVVHDPAQATAWPVGQNVICGHVHEVFKRLPRRNDIAEIVNVGVDVWDYDPVSLAELRLGEQ